MSKLASGVVRHAKQKIVQATVLDVLSSLCSVQLSGRGAVLHGLKFTGSAPSKGDIVYVDYRSGVPVVIAATSNIAAAIDELRQELTAANNVFSPPSSPPDPVPSSVDALDEIGDVDVAGVTDGQVLTYDLASELWIAADPAGGGSPLTFDDLTSQIPDGADHYDLAAEATTGLILFFNGVFQPSTYYTMDGDNEGLTLDFSPVSGDTLWAVYGTAAGSGGGGGTWGSITGTLADQTDLQAALDAKSDVGHDHDADYADIAHTHTRMVTFAYEGVIILKTGTTRIYNNFSATMTISKVFISIDTPPTGAAIIVDIHKNGTTLFTTQSNRPSIAISGNTGVTTTIENATWDDGDYLTMDIDQKGSGTAGSDLTVQVYFS